MLPCRFPEILEAEACLVDTDRNGPRPACMVTLRQRDGRWERRLVTSVLSRPEHYLVLNFSGCVLACEGCAVPDFAQQVAGDWAGPDDLALIAEHYAGRVTVEEPQERWTRFHGADLCRGCGHCLTHGRRADLCPGSLVPDQLQHSVLGLGPARNVVAFSGGELTCRPEYLAEAARAIRERAPGLHVMVESHGATLDDHALDVLQDGGVEAVGLTIAAADEGCHRQLTGAGGERVLGLPSRLRERGFTVEVLTELRPGLVERDQLARIATRVADADPRIPVTLLAALPQADDGADRATFDQMMDAADGMLDAGLRQFRLGNLGVFCHTGDELARANELAPR